MKKLLLFAVAFMAAMSGFAQSVVTDYEQSSFSSFPWKDAAVKESFDNGIAVLTNDAPTANFWDYQYWLFDGVSLNTNTEYTVTITGKAEGSGAAKVRYKVGNWDNGVTGEFNMTAGDDYKDYTFQVTPTIAENNGLLLQHGDFVGTIRWKAVKITHEGTPAEGKVKVLVVTSTANKTNDYDSQVFINLPTLTAGKTHYVKFLAKSTADFKFGSEGIDDKQEEHKNEWGNSAVLNYTAAGDVTSYYQEFTIELPGVTDVACTTHSTTHENFAYAPTALLLNLGKMPQGAVFTLGKMSVYDENYTKVADVALNNVAEYDKTKSAYYLGWQNAATFAIEQQDEPSVPTAINAVLGAKKESADAWYTVTGVKTNGTQKGLYIHNGKKVIVK